MTDKLALLGGDPVLDRKLRWKEIWPPVDQETEDKLIALYRSRLWSAFDGAEAAFAQAFAEHHGAKHGVFMMNGTVTLQSALGAYGIGAGDEVIVPPLTWYATAMAPYYLGAKPVFVDVNPQTLCIDPERIRAAITERTKAIIPVHVFGSMAEIDEIVAIGRQHNVRVIEDCAHAHGALWDGRGSGSIGDVGSFSCQQSKTMASGEGGLCITSDPAIAERMYRIAHIGYGAGDQQGVVKEGPPVGLTCHNFRATAFQAVVLREQLNTLNSRLDTYMKSVSYLESRLSRTTRIRFQQRPRKVQRQGFYTWVMIFDDPAYADIPVSLFEKAVNAEGLGVFVPWGLVPVYRYVLFNLPSHAYRVDQACPVTEHVMPRILCLLHAYLGLGATYVERIADVIEKVIRNADQLRTCAKGAGCG